MKTNVPILICVVAFLTIVQLSNGVVFKLTNAVCESYNKSWVVIDTCRLHALQRNKTIINISVTLLHPTNSVSLRGQVQKKANGYKPWLIDVTVNACQFMKGQQIVKEFYPRADKLPLKLPTGDYLLLMTWKFYGKIQFVTNVYFAYVEDLINS